MPNRLTKTPPPPPLDSLKHTSRPPFLVRNLLYVKNDRSVLRRHQWDLSWAASPTNARHLLLRIRPSLCILHPKTAQQLLHPSRPLSHPPPNPYNPHFVHMQISLVVRNDHRTMSFGSRRCAVMAWPEEHVTTGVRPVPDDVAVSFDLSAVMGIIHTFPDWLGLVVEMHSSHPDARPPNGFPATLKGHITLIDRHNPAGSVRNGHVKLPLSFVQWNQVGPLEPVDTLRPDRPVHATVSLRLWGGVRHLQIAARRKHKPSLHVRCTYKSSMWPDWEGVVRHDFLCPWCHRNCFRFRTLVTHLQVEHDQLGFSVEGAPRYGNAREVPMVLEFDVVGVEGGGGKRVGNVRSVDRNGNWAPACDEDTVSVYANPAGRFRALAPHPPPPDDMENGMAKVSISDRRPVAAERKSCCSADGASTDSEEEHDNFVEAVQRDLRDTCKYCARPRPRQGDKRYAETDFCSEFCDMAFRKKMTDTELEGDRGPELAPMLDMATVPRPQTFNYKDALGHLKLFHIVSVCEAKEEHFDPDDPDSEDEVDHSWRLDLSIERIRSLEDATAKDKLLWMMWNKYSHENYPIPSVYAERYTRYALELFALEYGPLVAQKRLRLQFVGFLRALYIHGLIDIVGIKSVMLCLDGRKKRRQCASSGRPEILNDQRARGKSRGAQRQRRSKKKN